MSSMFPAYGPVAGGTNIIISGALFGNNTSGVTVTFDGQLPFTVASWCVCVEYGVAPFLLYYFLTTKCKLVVTCCCSNDTYIHAISPPYTQSANGTSTFRQLTVTLATGFVLQAAMFQYRPNPIIYDVQPRKTFLKYTLFTSS
jgi:hypothetical protein